MNPQILRPYLLGSVLGLLVLLVSLTFGLASSENQYCEIWNATAVSKMRVESFCFETDITVCVHVQVWFKDGPYTGDTGSIEQGLFAPDTNIWTLMCEGYIEPQLKPNVTIIPPEICSAHILEPGQTRAYFVVGSECPVGTDISVADTTSASVENLTTFEEDTNYKRSESQCASDDPSNFSLDSTTDAPSTSIDGQQEQTVSPTANPTASPVTLPPTDPPTANLWGETQGLADDGTKDKVFFADDGPTTTNPTASPTINPTASPTVHPTVSPVTLPPTTASPSVTPTISTLAPSTVVPITTNSPSVSLAPTQCKYQEDDTGLLLACNADDQCGGYVDPVTQEQKGARCNPETCQCECDSKYCLTLNNKGLTKSNMCEFNCDCTSQCDVEGTAGSPGECSFACKDCSNDESVCGPDEDCIPSKREKNKSFCTDSGICTAGKAAMCDEAYSVVTGSNNNRAKCCPATSGCIKATFGVIKTATCGNSCGTSCLGYQSNPGNLEGDMPTSFCTFGFRVVNMPYCPAIAGLEAGLYSCDTAEGNQDSTGDNSICCATDPDPAIDRGDIEGQFNCTEAGFGPLSNQVCVDSSALTCTAGRITPTCDGTDGGCGGRRT